MLSWNEVRDNAIAFSRSWSDATRERADAQTFWNEFFAIFGRDRRTVASFEVAVCNIQGQYNFINLYWSGMLLVEHARSADDFSGAESRAVQYIADLVREEPDTQAPRYIMLTDFQRIVLFDLEPGENADPASFAGHRYTMICFPLSDLRWFIRHFAFIKREQTVRQLPIR